MSSPNTSNCFAEHLMLFFPEGAKCHCCHLLQPFCILLYLKVMSFLKSNFRVCFYLSSGEPGVYLHDYLHIRVLSQDSGVRVGVPWRRLFTELLEHIRLCHRLHGVRWAADCRWISLPPKATAYFWPHLNNCHRHLFLQSLHLCLGYHQ